ncbi:hypothetical protein NDU88_007192 [Pleurodeles waltl]|uniref:Uncharacterized protein n=1 Tax=Pleurodeles waltl TaxID=8319 RepID=A0AAV7PST9_PLEWA|nr:hypothetical protein NDU88_007192 [Pleurodeles waltl]
MSANGSNLQPCEAKPRRRCTWTPLRSSLQRRHPEHPGGGQLLRENGGSENSWGSSRQQELTSLPASGDTFMCTDLR